MASLPDPPAVSPASDSEADFVVVEVIYAEPQRQEMLRLKLPAGSTLRQAVAASGLSLKYPGLDPAKLGIYGKLSQPDSVLRAGDRVELYRSLQDDPKDIRKRRAAVGRARKG